MRRDPEVRHDQDPCIERLVSGLEARDGVERVHVRVARDGTPARLCIHHDPELLPLPRIRQLVEQAGARLTERYGHLLWRVAPIHGTRHARAISRALERAPGVTEAGASPAGSLRVELDHQITNEAAVRAALRKLGVRVVCKRPITSRKTDDEDAPQVPMAEQNRAATAPEQAAEHDEHDDNDQHEHGGIFGARTELIFAPLSGTALLAGWLLDRLAEPPAWSPIVCYLAAYFFGGFCTLHEAIDNLRARRFEIDFLMLVAAAGAAALGEWAEGALLLVLFSLGHALESYAMGRARRAIEALAELAPDTATVRRDGQKRALPVKDLEIGDVVIVKPDERLPADGFVLKGQSAVNQAPVTGESVPVDKRPVDDPEAAAAAPAGLAAVHRVFAGTINGTGALEIVATARAGETTLARVVQMVAEAETTKSPTQRLTDRFERIFVPVVLGLVVLLLFGWVMMDEPFSTSFYRAMAVLVAASPCALAIATPSAVLSGIARAGKGGLLVKGGGPLENLGALTAIAFDKTGTLTEGEPRVADIVASEGVEPEELLRIAGAVERHSDHPLAAAVVRAALERLDEELPDVRDIESITGRGIEATLDDRTVHIGKDVLFDEIEGAPLPEPIRRSVDQLERDGRTTMIVRHGDRYLGVLGLMDTPRPGTAGVVARLRHLGIRRMVMISGDNQRVAEAVAEQIGLDEARGDLLPADKVETIKALWRDGKVAMVGDGVNDAPAMASATVGIAMGAAGSDVALETADVALMADDLGKLTLAVGLSRRTSRIIKQNLWLSLGMVAFLIPATILGLNIGPAVALHEGSTLVVVFNALRLLAYREDRSF